MSAPEPDVEVTYLLDLDALDTEHATFSAGTPASTLVLPRSRWEALHRPGTVRVDVSPR